MHGCSPKKQKKKKKNGNINKYWSWVVSKGGSWYYSICFVYISIFYNKKSKTKNTEKYIFEYFSQTNIPNSALGICGFCQGELRQTSKTLIIVGIRKRAHKKSPSKWGQKKKNHPNCTAKMWNLYTLLCHWVYGKKKKKKSLMQTKISNTSNTFSNLTIKLN